MDVNPEGFSFTNAWVLNLPLRLMKECPKFFIDTQFKSATDRAAVVGFHQLLGILHEHNDDITPNGTLSDQTDADLQGERDRVDNKDVSKESVNYLTLGDDGPEPVPMFTYNHYI